MLTMLSDRKIVRCHDGLVTSVTSSKSDAPSPLRRARSWCELQRRRFEHCVRRYQAYFSQAADESTSARVIGSAIASFWDHFDWLHNYRRSRYDRATTKALSRSILVIGTCEKRDETARTGSKLACRIDDHSVKPDTALLDDLHRDEMQSTRSQYCAANWSLKADQSIN